MLTYSPFYSTIKHDIQGNSDFMYLVLILQIRSRIFRIQRFFEYTMAKAAQFPVLSLDSLEIVFQGYPSAFMILFYDSRLIVV